MEHRATKELRELIRRRSEILTKLKKAKGKTKIALETELVSVKKRISILDEKQN